MIDHIFINGCSFNQINPKGNVNTFAGEIIAKHFNKEFTNLSRGGRGNYRICATTKMWYEKNENKSFAIIEWTSPFRRDYTTNDGWKPIKGFNTTWRTWSTTSSISLAKDQIGWDFDQEHSLFMLNSILDLQYYFKANKIPYVMYHGLPGDIKLQYDDHKLLWNAVDKDHFYQPMKSQAEFVNDNKLFVSKNDYHPTAEGHQRWATGVIQFIQDKGLMNV